MALSSLFIVTSASLPVPLAAAESPPQVAVVMGSDSDLPTLQPAVTVLEEFGVKVEVRVLSAHRTPLEMVAFAKEAHQRGLKVIVAGAGGAAHLPGMVASLTTLPVIGVPVQSRALSGVDSLHSIVQMPGESLWQQWRLVEGLMLACWRLRSWRSAIQSLQSG